LNDKNDDDDPTLKPKEIAVHDEVLDHAYCVANVEKKH